MAKALATPGAGAQPATSLTRNQACWLLATAVLTLVPHTPYLPAWVTALCMALLGWRALRLWRGQLPPHRLLIMLATIGACLGIRVGFGQFFGKDPGVSLLAILLCLKLLETKVARDIRVAVLLAFFLQLSIFFENQSLPVAALALCATLLALASLLALVDANASTKARLRTSALLAAQGLPFMLVLFVLFPRVQGPLWGLPADAFSARSGLAESMQPGSISQLGLSEEIAFRAEFDGLPPPPGQRYWRGPVLSEFDGTTWRPATSTIAAEPSYQTSGPRMDYRLTLEPHNRNWLLALDFPAAGLQGVRYSSDFRALADTPVRHRSRFNLAAYPETGVGLEETPDVLAAARRLPAGSNPRTHALAQQLAAEAGSNPRAILERVQHHLREAKLTYTLEPPLLGQQAIDEFLFDSRRGFCEHFSATFVFLMRAAGVPARVVTGYQGGEINPIDGSLVVRQSDAHAWAEVWIDGRGWERADPTALAAPDRIDSGLSAGLPATEARLLAMPDWLRSLRYRWEAANNAWNQWILGYNPERQRDLLARLGLRKPDWGTLATAMSIAASVLMGLLLLWAQRQRQARSPLQKSWDSFCRTLARHGLTRHPWEGPADYGKRLAFARPAQAKELRDICTEYARLRYGFGASSEDIRSLQQRITKLKLT